MRLRAFIFVIAAIAAPSAVVAAPLLTSITSESWTFQFPDGSSNTIRFGENTGYTMCLPRTVTSGFGDGTSNTLVFGENTGVRLRWISRFGGITDGTSNTITVAEGTAWECFQGTSRPEPVIGQINDGTSNTIVFGEDSVDLWDKGFDACFTDVQVTRITDGTSNTIQFGENRCFSGIRVGPGTRVQAPAPPAAALLLLGAAAFANRIRRRRR